MYKSLKDISEEIGISKQRAYRFIKDNHINETVRSGQTKLYDEAVQNRIKKHFSETNPHQRTASRSTL